MVFGELAVWWTNVRAPAYGTRTSAADWCDQRHIVVINWVKQVARFGFFTLLGMRGTQRAILERKPATFFAVANIAADAEIHVIESQPPVAIAQACIQCFGLFLGAEVFHVVMRIQLAHF